MIRAGFPTRVYHVTHGGFDTHAAQNQKLAYLLQELSQAVGLFQAELEKGGVADRVLGMTFSEFGRRVAENKNQGTDHGAANVMFLFGNGVKPGIIGGSPDLANLDPLGDIAFKNDFRSVYSEVLSDWLGADPSRILPGNFPKLNFLKMTKG
jgi:uncharacterized protein (DUF1501 family)